MSLKSSSIMLAVLLALLLTGCGAAVVPIIPTNLPTVTVTFTPTLSRTPGVGATPTLVPTQPPMTVTGGPSPTPLFGPTSTPAAIAATATERPNPNAPRIEFFTANVLAAAPGEQITLFWSSRGADGATIYRLDDDGLRNQVWNVPPDGSLAVQTRRSDRDEINFILSVGEGDLTTEQRLTLPLSCPDAWFFEPAPEACPTAEPEETTIIEQQFERGRMLYVFSTDRVYVLFNDGFEPAWAAFENRFDPTTDPETEPNFVPPEGFVQPVRRLGFVWRGSDLVRNRLGLGLQPEVSYDGFVQAALAPGGAENLFVSSNDGSVLQLEPGGDAWQIITPP